ncbi:rod shape-determining protein [Streptomyces macrosporus]|uniref:Rod shape-determining protein n=1 Tax=Streptomyces macrosporus TaxID=44032 RepID=A0ABP5WJI2_9ACTN
MTDTESVATSAHRFPTWPACRLCPGVAIDLGSTRTRAWTQGRRGIIDVPTVAFPDSRVTHPIRRGTIVDADGTARMVERLLGGRIPRFTRPVVAFTTPVLSDRRHHTAATEALEVLRPRTVLPVESARAIALGARADLSRPLLVVDLGAHLTEVALLVDGTVSAARRTALGTSDLDTTTPRGLVAEIAAMVTDMLRGSLVPHLVDALERGPLLGGGGALRPEVTYQLSLRLDTPIHPAPQPHTAALRGAAEVLRSALRHPR